MTPRVAITGIGLLTPLSASSQGLFASLCQGQSAIRPLNPTPLDGRTCSLAAQLVDLQAEKHLSGRPLRPLDRNCQLAIIACGFALQNSGWCAENRSDVDVSLVIGTMFGGMHTIGEFDRMALLAGPASVSPMSFANTVISAATGQTAIWHHLRGINSTIAAGSISGLSAVSYASDLIRLGRAKTVVAGGVDEFSIESHWGFCRADLLCANHTGREFPIPFDSRRNGFALGEAAALLALEDLSYASARGAQVLGEVRGYAAAFDPARSQNSALAVATLVRAIQTALQRSGMTPDDIDFVSASANGSVAQDHNELTALAQVFGARAASLPVTAIKSGTGEALGASGPLQIAVAVETIKNGQLPGIIGLQTVPQSCALLGLSAATRKLKARSGLMNGVGLDGSCCSLVITAIDETTPS